MNSRLKSSQNTTSHRAIAQHPVQRQTITSIVDNRPIAVKQRKIQESVDARAQQIIQRQQPVGQFGSTTQFAKRKGIKRIIHAIMHPQRAARNRNRGVSTTDTDDMQWVEDMKPKKVEIPGMTHDIEEIDHEQVLALVDQLKGWLNHVNKLLADNEEYWQESKNEKDELDEYAYYSGEQDDFRRAHKEKMRLLSDCRGAKTEIESILKDIESGTERHYIVARKDGELQGILQTTNKSKVMVANIAVNPANIVPPEGEQPVKNTLRDMLQPVVATNLKNKTDIDLFALSTRVKKIYAHYGFLVDDHAERPDVKRDSNKWRTHTGKQQTDNIKKRHPWFDSNVMSMNPTNQQQFLQTYYS